MKFDRSNKFDLCYYGQVNSLRLKSSVASKGNIYFAGEGRSKLPERSTLAPCFPYSSHPPQPNS